MTIPTSDGASYWEMSKGRTVAPPPLSSDQPTDEDIRIDMSVRCARDLGPAPTADADEVVAESTPREYIERRHPARGLNWRSHRLHLAAAVETGYGKRC